MRLKDTLTRIGVQSYELFVKTPKLLGYKKNDRKRIMFN